MLIKSRAIVLHTLKYNDESLIVELLTEATGCVSFIVRISRSGRAAVRHMLFRPLALLDVEWNHRGGSGLRRLKSALPAVPLVSLPTNRTKRRWRSFWLNFCITRCARNRNPDCFLTTFSNRWNGSTRPMAVAPIFTLYSCCVWHVSLVLSPICLRQDHRLILT